MNETLQPILVGIVGAFVLIVTIILVCIVFGWIEFSLFALFGSRFSRLRANPEQVQKATAQRLARLRNPQFGVLEAHYGAPVPESLRRLYLSDHLLQEYDFRFGDPDDPQDGASITDFLPADKQALDEIGWEFGQPLFPFAADGFGNYYCVLIQAEATDPCPVYFWDHEIPGTLEEMKIADSLDEFVARPRVPDPNAEDGMEEEEGEE